MASGAAKVAKTARVRQAYRVQVRPGAPRTATADSVVNILYRGMASHGRGSDYARVPTVWWECWSDGRRMFTQCHYGAGQARFVVRWERDARDLAADQTLYVADAGLDGYGPDAVARELKS